MTFYQQVQRAIDYIECHLFDDVDHQELASKAFMSVASFYRYFGALTGFSVKEYVRKRRLCESLTIVEQGKDSLLSIAVDCGYNSHEAFTRAFKREFGRTPMQYRLGSMQLRGVQPKKLVEETFMGLLIKEMSELSVALYRVISASPEQDAWLHMKTWGESVNLFSRPYRCFGFDRPGPEAVKKVLSAPDSVATLLDVDQYEYGYEVQVAFDSAISPKVEANHRGVRLETMASGKFAVLGIGAGCAETDIGRGWQQLMALVDEAGYKPTGRWLEEHLDFEMGSQHEPARLDLYLEIE